MAFPSGESAGVVALDPGLRRDDDIQATGSSSVIPAQAGIQRLSRNIY